MQVFQNIPSHLWEVHTHSETQIQLNMIRVARQMVAAWWRLVQVGVDMPPLRSNMIMSLSMSHTYGCKQHGCSIQGCHGNMVSMNYAAGIMLYEMVHHKSVMAQFGPLAGPISPSPPRGSLTERLTSSIMHTVLPFVYSIMHGVPTDSPLPMLPNIFGQSVDEDLQFKEFNHNSYGIYWEKTCLGACSVMPKWTSNLFSLDTLELVSHPFPGGTFMSSDNRRHFVTALVENQDLISSVLGGEVALISEVKQLANDTLKVHIRSLEFMLESQAPGGVSSLTHAPQVAQ